MKKLLLIITAIITNQAMSQETVIEETMTTFILVRHAEKAGADADPDLSAQGMERAAELSRMFQNVAVDAIYATPYKRTHQTVNPLARSKNIAVTEYSTKRPYGEFVYELRTRHRGKTIVIAGHTNTIPKILDALTGEPQNVIIDEANYENLYIVSIAGSVRPSVLRLKYGK